MKNAFAYLLTGLMTIAFGLNAWADGPYLASCSAGPIQGEAAWYGDVSLPQFLAINTKTYEVIQSLEEPSVTAEDWVTFNVALDWHNPRFVPEKLSLKFGDVRFVGKTPVMYSDDKKDLRIDCQIKK